MVPDLILKAILSTKKNVSEIIKFCENNDICQDKPGSAGEKQIRQVVAKQMFKVSGYSVDKEFNYRRLFGEMSRVLLKYRASTFDLSKSNSLNLDNSMDNLVKIKSEDRKSLAATGSIELYAFLLHNGIDLRSLSPTGGNFKLSEINSYLDSLKTTEI